MISALTCTTIMVAGLVGQSTAL